VTVTVKTITSFMEEHFPRHLAENWDNVGLQVGSYNHQVKKVMICLDLDYDLVHYAVSNGCNLIITHHPLIFSPLKNINYDTPRGRLIRELIKADISLYCAHTNLDAAPQGLNQVLAQLIGLEDISPLNEDNYQTLYKLVVYVPVEHLDGVRSAICSSGAGYIGNYSDCSFRIKGTGTFKPMEGSHPFIGECGVIEEVEEYRLESIVPQQNIRAVLDSLHKAHPYEEVAYDLYRLENKGDIYSLGRRGYFEKPITLKNLANHIKKTLNTDKVRIVGEPDRKITRCAVASGAGASFINQISAAGIDVLITGDVKYHEARDAQAVGLSIIDAGHQETEQIIVPYLTQLLTETGTERNWDIEVLPVASPPCFSTI